MTTVSPQSGDDTIRVVVDWTQPRDEFRQSSRATGARLPTVTELWRTNATRGTGNIGNSAKTNELWTLLQNRNINHMSVRISDLGPHWVALVV